MTATSSKSTRDTVFKKPARLETPKQAVEYWEAHSRIRTHDTQRGLVNALSWNCDGTRLAAGSQDGSLCVTSVDGSFKLRNVLTTTAHSDQICGVAFHPSNAHLVATAALDKSVCLWDIRSSKQHTTLSTKTGNLSVTWSPCGRWLLYIDKDDRLHLIDGRSLQNVKPALDFKTQINEAQFDSTGKFIFVGAGGGKVEVLSVPDLSPVYSMQALSSAANCQCVSVSPDGSRLAAGGTDALVSIINIDNMICENTVPRLDWPLRSVSFSHDGTMLAAGSEDHMIDISWVEDGSRVYEIKTDAELFSLSWHPSNYILAYAVNTVQGTRDRDRATVRLFGLHC